MTGLVSRWADEEDLQPDTVKTAGPASPKVLESRWATDTAQENLSPSSDISSKYKKLELALDEPEHSKHKNKPRKARNHPRDHKQRPHSEPNASNDNNDDEPLPPMTDAARSLASRLGHGISSPPASAGRVSRPPSEPKKHSSSKKHEKPPPARAIATPPSDAEDGFVTTDEEVSDEDLPPMSEAGKSLASRLGMMSVDQKSQNTAAPKAKYQTPKQKREEAVKKKRSEETKRRQEAEAQRLEKEREAAQKEIDRILAEMSDPNLSWADI